MNEYIVHGKTGYLYNPKRPGPLDLGDIARIQRHTRDFMIEGYSRWKVEREGILALLQAQPGAAACKPWVHLAFRCLLHPFQASRTARKRFLSISIKKGRCKVHLFGLHWETRQD